MKTMDKYMYLPTMTENEFAENIGREDFFRTYGNPVVVHTKAGERYIALSAELYNRIMDSQEVLFTAARIRFTATLPCAKQDCR